MQAQVEFAIGDVLIEALDFAHLDLAALGFAAEIIV